MSRASACIFFIILVIAFTNSSLIADEWHNYSAAGWMNVDCATLGPDGSIWAYGGLGNDAGGFFQTVIEGDALAWRYFSPYNSLAATDLVKTLYADLIGLWVGRIDGLTLFNGLYSVLYTTENSPLPGNVVLEICGDGAGGVWVATNSGLCNINGPQWSTITHENSPLPENFVSGAMCFDCDCGRLFLAFRERIDSGTGPATYGHCRLLVFDGESWTEHNEDNSGIPDGIAQDIILDKTGCIWIAYQQNGICCFDGASWVHYTDENSGLPSSRVCDLAMNQEGEIYAISSCMCKFVEGQWVALPILTRWPYTRFHGTLFDRKGDAWVFSTEGYLRISEGLTTLHCPEGMSLLDAVGYDKILPSRFSDAVHIASYGSGISRFENGDWQTWTIGNSGLPSKDVIDIAEGPDGALWAWTMLPLGDPIMGTKIYSLDRFDGSQWSNFSSGIGYFNGCNAKALVVDEASNVWVAVEGRVLRYDGAFWTAFPLTGAVDDGRLFSMAIEPATGALWVGGVESLFRRHNGEWTTLPTNLGYIESLTFDRDGVLWATSKSGYTSGGWMRGIMSYNGSEIMYYDPSNTPLLGQEVSGVAVDGHNVKWFAVEGGYTTNSVASFDGSEWKVYTCENSGLIRAYEGKTPKVISVAVDRQDRVWFGTKGFGVSCLSNAGQPDPFPTVEVFVDSPIYSNGDFMRASIVETNLSGADLEVNLLTAIALPDDTLLFFPEWTPNPMVFMPQWIKPGTVTIPEVFIEITVGAWMPRGQYTWFAAFTDTISGDIIGSISHAIFTIE